MTKRTPNRAKQAASREAASLRRAAADRQRRLSDVALVASRLAALDLERNELVAARDAQVVRLIADGVSVAEIARHTGLSRQALMKRL